MKKLAIIGDFVLSAETHIATNAAIENSKTEAEIEINAEWIPTDTIIPEQMKSYDGFWIAPGSPYKSMENVLSVIEHARKNNLPILGTCGGFQHMVIEYARNVLGFENAVHEEYTGPVPKSFISKLSSSLAGKQMMIELTSESEAARIYGVQNALEKYFCSYGVNPEMETDLLSGPMKFTGKDQEGGFRVLELPGHPFFIGTLFVPQVMSSPEKPHPMITAFLDMICK